jgi:preprotein translocase YajC subunit
MPAEQLGSMYPFIMMIVVIAFFYFFAVRPQKKREKEINAMRDALRVGDRVTTIGGIQFIGQFEDQTAGGFLSDAGDCHKKFRIFR